MSKPALVRNAPSAARQAPTKARKAARTATRATGPATQSFRDSHPTGVDRWCRPSSNLHETPTLSAGVAL